jgi:CubicO group peptidase (beta-lactamase class C family)
MADTRIFLIAAALLPGGCSAHPKQVPLTLEQQVVTITRQVEAQRQQLHVPGASLAIIKGDSIVLLRGFGLRSVEESLPVTPQTLFAAGSCTKTLTALLVVISADQGKLSLDDSPRRFLLSFHLPEPRADSLVTLRDLLSHRTGLKVLDGDSIWFSKYHTPDEIIRFATEGRSLSGFRNKFQYNNFMYLAAGEMIARANGIPYDSLVIRALLRPLGMETSSLTLEAMQRSGDVASGYSDQDDRHRIPVTHLAFTHGIAPAAALSSNARDMAQLVRLLLGRGVFKGHRVVSERGFAEMLKKEVSTTGGFYGLGLFAEPWHGHRRYFHHGGVPGFGSRFEFLPDDSLGFVILTNVDDQTLPNRVREIIYTTMIDHR